MKNKSTKITNSTKFGKTIGNLRVYREDLTPLDFDDYPQIIVSAGEDLKKFQYGFIRIKIKKNKEESESYLVQVDGLLTIVYGVYAKVLNSFRNKNTNSVRIYGFFRKLYNKIFN